MKKLSIFFIAVLFAACSNNSTKLLVPKSVVKNYVVEDINYSSATDTIPGFDTLRLSDVSTILMERAVEAAASGDDDKMQAVVLSVRTIYANTLNREFGVLSTYWTKSHGPSEVYNISSMASFCSSLVELHSLVSEDDNSSRKALEGMLRNLLEPLKTTRLESGTWSRLPNSPYTDATTTCRIAYAMAVAVRLGCANDEYGLVAAQAINKLVEACPLDKDGLPQLPDADSQTLNYFKKACVELYKIL